MRAGSSRPQEPNRFGSAHAPAERVQGRIFSSWDRNSRTYSGANEDAGQYLGTEPDGEAVMLDIDEPGVIYRTWSANPMGKIRFYLDSAQTPSFKWNFPGLFDGKLPPFIKPLVYRRDRAQSASDCYLPISCARHIKTAADKAHAADMGMLGGDSATTNMAPARPGVYPSCT